jgi:hypothetical protein
MHAHKDTYKTQTLTGDLCVGILYYMYIFMYTRAHTHTHTPTKTHTYRGYTVSSFLEVQSFVYGRRYTHTYMHRYMHTYIHTNIHMCTLSRASIMQLKLRHSIQTRIYMIVFMYTYIHKYMHKYTGHQDLGKRIR